MSRNSEKKAASPKAETGEQVKKRWKSKKLRPQSAEALTLAIQENRLDNRTRAAQDMVALRDAIVSNPQEAAKAIVRDSLAASATIMSAVLREITGPDASIVDEDGNVHPLIAKIWPDLHRSTLQAAKALAAMEREGNPTPPTPDGEGAKDIATIILEAQAHENDE